MDEQLRRIVVEEVRRSLGVATTSASVDGIPPVARNASPDSVDSLNDPVSIQRLLRRAGHDLADVQVEATRALENLLEELHAIIDEAETVADSIHSLLRRTERQPRGRRKMQRG